MVSFLELMPGESLYGFFLRDATINNPTLLTSREFWVYSDPFHALRIATKFNKYSSDKYRCYLSDIGQEKLAVDHTLCSLYRPLQRADISLDDEKISLFSQGVHYADHRTTRMLLCRECYKEQMEGYGFFWLKTDWINPYVKHCFIHSTELFPAWYAYRELVPECKFPRYLKNVDNKKFSEKLNEKDYVASSDPMYLLGKWFHDLRLSNLPYTSKSEEISILADVYSRLGGRNPNRQSDIARFLFSAMEELKREISDSNDEATRKTPFHGRHDLRQISDSFGHGHWRMSTIQFWSLVYLAYKDFGLFNKQLCSGRKVTIPIAFEI